MAEFKDTAGNTYFSPDKNPAGHGVEVKLPGGGTGVMNGGVVIPTPTPPPAK
jgi:hypothetical protein